MWKWDNIIILFRLFPTGEISVLYQQRIVQPMSERILLHCNPLQLTPVPVCRMIWVRGNDSDVLVNQFDMTTDNNPSEVDNLFLIVFKKHRDKT